MDCLCVPVKAPHRELAYKLANHCLSPEGQARHAKENLQGITNLAAVPLLSESNRRRYNYHDIRQSQLASRATLWPMPPVDPGAPYATLYDMLTEYDRLLRA